MCGSTYFEFLVCINIFTHKLQYDELLYSSTWIEVILGKPKISQILNDLPGDFVVLRTFCNWWSLIFENFLQGNMNFLKRTRNKKLHAICMFDYWSVHVAW